MSIQSLEEDPGKDTYSGTIENSKSIWWRLQQTMLTRENCPFKNEAAATPAAKADANSKPKADAKPKAEPSASAKKTPKSKAKPAAPAIRVCRAWNPLAPAIQKRSSYVADDESIDSDADSDCWTDDEAPGSVLPASARKGRSVTFAKDVKFQSSRPRKSYKDRSQEIIGVMKAFVENESRANEVEFASARPD